MCAYTSNDGSRLLGWSMNANKAESFRRISEANAGPLTDAERAKGKALAAQHGPFAWADVAWDLHDRGAHRTAWAFWVAVLDLYDTDARVYLHASDSALEAGNLSAAEVLAHLGFKANAMDCEGEPHVTLELAAAELAEHLAEHGEVDLFDLRWTLFDDRYLAFTLPQLADALAADERFDAMVFEGSCYVDVVSLADSGLQTSD